MAYSQPFDVAIIGGGIAGLSVALRLPEHVRVALFTKGQLGESNTRYAQGGLSVALGTDDSPELHYQDTIAAGAGLCDEEAVRILVEGAPAAVRWLIAMGVEFDRAQAGDAHATADGLLLGREGAHSRWRVLHAGGDATGAEIERALMTALRSRRSIVLYEETFVRQLIVQNGVCLGVEALNRKGETISVSAHATVLASGGVGGLWWHTSNPAGATADGLALAWQSGAALTDLEFMQFHPTVLVANNGTSHLISEAVRGEGAYLRNHAGERFMPRYSEQAELAPRDVVARAILSEMLKEGTNCQYLDLRHLSAEKMHARFPTISAICCQFDLNLAQDLIPVAPAAHYCMGGVKVDTAGRTTVPGLYAVGEVACTGVHGANRLASNSLLEGLVYGIRVADVLADQVSLPLSTTSKESVTVVEYYSPLPKDMLSSGNDDVIDIQQIRREVRQLMWKYVSLCRERAGLLEAQQQIQALRQQIAGTIPVSCEESVRWIETRNMLQVAELVIFAALERCESRGSHWRLDYQSTDEALVGHHYVLQPLGLKTSSTVWEQEEVVPYV